MDYNKHFDIPNDILYLNTPGNGLLPKTSKTWRLERDISFFDTASDLRDKQLEFLVGVKQKVVDLFHSKFEQTFLTPNFSFGYNTLIDLLPKGYRYLVLEEEYPSLQYPIVNRKLNYIQIKPSTQLEEDLAGAIKFHKPDVLVLSIVQYISGLKVDLNFIKKLKKENPSLIILADGTQYLGTEPFNFTESGFDAVASSGYKWLLSGFGNGFICLSEQLVEVIREQTQDIPKPQAAMWANKSLLSTYFEPGHQDTLSHGTLGHSLTFLSDIGLNNIEFHLQALKKEAYQLLGERGWLLPHTKRAIQSSVINIQVDPQLYPNLLNSGVKCFPRGTGIRIGLHLYNNLADIHRLINILESIQ